MSPNAAGWGAAAVGVVLVMQLVLLLRLRRVLRRQREEERHTLVHAAEDAMRANEKRTRALLKAIPDLMFVLRRDGTYLDYHAQSSRDLFVPAEQFLGRNMKDVMPAALAEQFFGCFDEAMRTGGPVNLEYSLPSPDGHLDYEARIVRRDEDTVVSTVRDITERKRAEHALREAHAQLAHVNRVLTVGELAYSIAHELNQPLCAILANATACAHETVRPAPDLGELRAIAADIQRDAKRAGDVIAHIRTLVRKAPSRITSVDINEVVREVAQLLRSDVAIAGVALHVQLSDEPLVIDGDRVQLQQVLLNLIRNAVDATKDAGQPRASLSIRSWRNESGTVEVAVSDSGVGLLPGEEERVFEPFYTTKTHGMGMGLAISRSIVEAHAGRLWATANDNRGATFRFTMPSAASDSMASLTT
jgi:PAS domain S-box-containing protein